MFQFLKNRKRRKAIIAAFERMEKRRAELRAGFDAAKTNDDNKRHWANADLLSGQAWASVATRQKLRSRSRYEIFNNGYGRGIVETLANDTIGTGPRLQMQNLSPEVAILVERRFHEWAASINLAAKLRLMRRAKCIDGESFALFVPNPVRAKGVPMDVRVYEADQIATPWGMTSNGNAVDGIVFDDFGNPAIYHFLKRHPGDEGSSGFGEGVDPIKAENVIHYFSEDRPGQRRGLPEVVSSLQLLPELRRFTLAVLAAAETAADFAGVAQTKQTAEDAGGPSATPYDTIELERRMLTVLPDNYELGQIKAEQPATTYREFKGEVINEIARPLNMPFNIAACNSASYNYASGRMDHQTYFKSLTVERSFIAAVILDRIFAKWFELAVLTEGYLPQEARMADFDPAHVWFWDGQEHVDPTKEATADETNLRNNTTTLAEIYAAKGQDWESQIQQRSRELELMRRLEVPVASGGGAMAPAQTPAEDDDDEI